MSEINESINMKEIRPLEYFNYRIDRIIIFLNVFSCFCRLISNGFFFLLLHYIDKLKFWEREIYGKSSLNMNMNTIITQENNRQNVNIFNEKEEKFCINGIETEDINYNCNNLEERLNIKSDLT